MVRYEGSQYSVPPAYAGKPVRVVAESGQIFVRVGDTIIAEHRKAAKPNQSVVEKEHLTELWRLIQEQIPCPEDARWQIQFEDSVQQVPLHMFEELAG